MKRILAILSQCAVAVFAASYQVPAPVELLKFAQWDIADRAEAVVEGTTLKVHYQLPSDLVGEGNGKFAFTGKVSGRTPFVNVEGDGVFGSCMFSKDKPLTCMLKYPGMEIDVAARDLALELNHRGDALGFANFSQVSRLFSADPAGLLSVEVKRIAPQP